MDMIVIVTFKYTLPIARRQPPQRRWIFRHSHPLQAARFLQINGFAPLIVLRWCFLRGLAAGSFTPTWAISAASRAAAKACRIGRNGSSSP